MEACQRLLDARRKKESVLGPFRGNLKRTTDAEIEELGSPLKIFLYSKQQHTLLSVDVTIERLRNGQMKTDQIPTVPVQRSELSSRQIFANRVARLDSTTGIE